MSFASAHHGASRPRWAALLATAVTVGVLALGGTAVGSGPSSHLGRATGSPPLRAESSPESPGAAGGAASAIELLGSPPASVMAGVPLALAWEAMNATGSRATSFSVACALTVASSGNGSSVPAWVNATSSGAVVRAPNGSFAVPPTAWADGLLSLTVTVATAAPVTVQLEGGLLPALPPPVTVSVTADLAHLALYAPEVTVPGARENDTFWHVRDRFGDPAPGAFLLVELWTEAAWSATLVPVTWASGGTTGAWVNYSAAGPGNATLRVADEANATLLGPIAVPALGTASAPAAPSLPPEVQAAVALLGVAGGVGIVGLLLGTRRRRPRRSSPDGEEELRRLAEGRMRVVELVGRAGSMGLAEIEAAWEPPPAPPALADWLASLVTDGTLTATVGDGGRARFSLADRSVGTPTVTLDEAAMRREVARRDAATNEGAGDDGTSGAP